MDNMHRMHCTIGCNRTITNEYMDLNLLPNSLFVAGWNDASKQKENAQSHCQSMHDAGHTNHGLAALRHDNAKRKNTGRRRT